MNIKLFLTFIIFLISSFIYAENKTAINYISELDPEIRPKIRIINSEGVSEKTISLGINFISRKRTIVNPVSKNGFVFINLMDYGISPEKWDEFAAKEPYSNSDDDLSNLVKSKKPMIHGDWFLTYFLEAPIYYRLLDIKDLNSFFSLVTHDPKTKILEEKIVYESKIALLYRKITRWPTLNGYLYASFEDKGEVNYLASLPNGLQCFYISNDKKQQLDHGDVNLHKDFIYAGIACMQCHEKGAKSFKNTPNLIEKDVLKELFDIRNNYKLPVNKTTACKELGWTKEKYDEKIKSMTNPDVVLVSLMYNRAVSRKQWEKVFINKD